MKRDFDTDTEGNRGARLAQDFTFKLGGTDFELRHGLRVGSTALDGWRPVLDRMTADEEERAGWAEAHDGAPYVKVEDDEFLEVWTSTMHLLLKPGQEAALDRVLANEEEPVMLPDLVDVILWAVRTVTAGRPTVASPGSSSGSPTPSTGPGGSSSTAASSSPEDAASPA